ncbi:EAL domain-containing protein [Clostridium magnum]|uniref:Stage 0 sporulation protein A homolog n=1 Tax=Clostridium magnum DSM 2767 TaxID=1121326 RepID=A0A161X430_9CLOT|nr:EAL domain-containing protein [Clostridium magnum]KZL94278.1 cyclic di-GMP phosphodiesterase Gmr [Clostridium magnum DSM 2767]SHH91132.1 response regulator receiver modulated diguanylate cyclase/phosphodiesterase with PAS/PAC sensor(s) [Clostridium magnum DSM 2767]
MIDKMFDKRKSLILVADDSRFMRFTLREFLEKDGYEVIEAKNGKQVLSLFEERKPDIILMDFMMPEIDGVSACAQLQQLPQGRNTPVIMITSLDDEESVNLAFEAGATDYIGKPINWAVLRKRLSRLLQARRTEITLDQNDAFASSIINHAIEGIITIDVNGIIGYINPSAEKIFGYASNEVIGASINMLIPELCYNDCTNLDVNSKFPEKNLEILGRKKNNSNLPLEATISKFYVDDRFFFTIILRDITERRHYEETIRYQAFYDSLTDLPNRLLLKDRIELEISHSKHTNQNLAIMYLDLDRFKLINDTLGHDIGDKLLKEIAVRLKSCVNETDTVARIGGDEFVILLPAIAHEENIGNIATKILETIRETIIIDSHELYISVSIGVTIYPDDGKDVETLLTNADVAMYRAKEKGKNNFQLYTPALNEKALERLAMENSLRRALEYKEFVVYYQPKVSTETEQIIGMEALIRWQHPNWGLVPPAKFIPLAEETGLIVPIGEWVLRTACAQTKAFQNAGLPPLTVAVNLSALQFQLQDLTTMVSNVLEETGLDPRYLELEITESIAMQNVEHTIKMINELKAMGIKFAIDDFGTGYSSLSQLNSFSVNKLKIDKSFVSKIDGVKDHSIIASTVLALGKSMALGVVAEGVENQEQVNFFKLNKCDEMQGYFFGKPMSKEDFEMFYYKKLHKD